MASTELEAKTEFEVPSVGLSAHEEPEKYRAPLASIENEEAGVPHQQRVGKLRWISICVGFCLGAMLYGIMITLPTAR